MNLLQVAAVLVRRWRLVVGAPLASAVIAGGISLIVPPMYTGTVSFIPESGIIPSIPANLAGLAGRFGLALGGEANQSPAFYADLLTSPRIMDRVLLDQYRNPRAANGLLDSVGLLVVLDAEGRDLLDSLHDGRKRLRDLMALHVDNQTGVVSLDIDSRHPDLAAEVANRFVTHLNWFNASSRQSQARERRRFLDARLTDVQQELRTAEEDLKAFYERNRTWEQSPQLRFEEQRLSRRLQLSQDLYLTLRRELESARIEEVNDTPVITVISPATSPRERSRPKRLVIVALTTLITVILSVVAAFGVDYVARAAHYDDKDYRLLVDLVGQGRREMRSIVQKIFRGRARG